MPAYVFTREKDPKSISIRSIVKRLAPASFKEHPVVFAPDMVVKKSWRGPFEEILILDFPGDEEAKAWYHSPASRERTPFPRRRLQFHPH
jgi:hypothetical protein